MLEYSKTKDFFKFYVPSGTKKNDQLFMKWKHVIELRELYSNFNLKKKKELGQSLTQINTQENYWKYYYFLGFQENSNQTTEAKNDIFKDENMVEVEGQ